MGTVEIEKKEREKFFYSPYVVMSNVAISYIIRIFSKLYVGYLIVYQAMIADAFHNISDIGQVLIIMFIVYLSKTPPSTDYPLGRQNAASLAELSIGLSLIIVSFQMFFQLGADLLIYIPEWNEEIRSWVHFLPEYKKADIQKEYLWKVIIVLGGSAGLSFLTSVYQIKAGKKLKEKAIERDGNETRGDGWIELSVLVAIISEYLLQTPWIGHIFVGFIVVKLFLVGWESFKEGGSTLLQKSIGEGVEKIVEKAVFNVCGVEGAEDIHTFKIGGYMAVINMKVITDSYFNVRTNRNIKHAIVDKIIPYLKEQGFIYGKFYIRFDHIGHPNKIIAYAIYRDPETQVEIIAPGIETANIIRIATIDDKGENPRDADKLINSKNSLQDIIAYLEEEQADCYVAFMEDEKVIKMLEKAGINYKNSPTLSFIF